MNLEYLKKREKIVSMAMLGLSVIFVIVILFELGGYFMAPARASSLVEKFIKDSDPNDNDVKAQLAKSRAMANDLKKKNLFIPPVPKKHPVSVVLGILGDQALINGKWYKAGAKVGDAKVVAVEPTLVRIEWEGKEKIFSPITGGSSSASGGESRNARSGGSSRPGGSGRESPSVVSVESGEGGHGFGGPGEGGMRGGFGDREAMRARFENMSEAERMAFRDRMRERFGGRGGPGGRGGFGGDRGGGRGGPGGGRGGR